MARSPEISSLTVAFWNKGGEQPLATTRVTGLSSAWGKLHGTLTLPVDAPADVPYKFTLTADAPGQLVVRHVFLLPADAINGADPDIVRFLKAAHLPLLRWPGGNFVSTYHWQDGIGPVEQRPTKPNYAWGAIEPNTFGTDEFIAFCRAVGCEPMICLNAGSGSPAEAAQWLEYCNGPATSPMGRVRSANGHPEPFHVQRWEVGNELWGHWQMEWSTASGYVDRYKGFAQALVSTDPDIRLYACGAPAMSGKQWNDTLISGLGTSLVSITDHPLIGGNVPPSTDPLDVYRDFMAVPEVLQQKWAGLRADMVQGGVRQPKLAVTELQLFAHLSGSSDSTAPVRLTRENFPGQASMTEAIYDVLIYHAALRLAPFVELVTHSAVVNHGGGLRKERERVWANPCHYAQAAFAAFAEATPVPVEIETATESAPMVLPDLRHATNTVSFGAIDALAAIGKDGSLLVSLVHRGSSGSIHLQIDLQDFNPAGSAELQTLTAGAPWDGNSLEQPEAVKPVDSIRTVQGKKLDLDVSPYTVMRVRMPGSR